MRSSHRRFLSYEIRLLLDNPSFHDAVIVYDDGELACNRLIPGLLFPHICLADSMDEVVVVQPGTRLCEGREAVVQMLTHDRSCCLTRTCLLYTSPSPRD